MRAVNLIPSEQRRSFAAGPGRSGGSAYAVLGLLAGLAIMALLYGLANRQVASRQSQITTTIAQAQQAQSAAERLAPYSTFISMREKRVQAVESLVDSRFDWAHAFHEFGRVLPDQVSISSLGGAIGTGATTTSSSATSASASSATVTSSTPPGSVPNFTLTGCAMSQRAVALTLERLRLIDGVSNVTLATSTKGTTTGSGGTGGCPAGDPAFTAQITFAPLPSAAVLAAGTKTVSASPGSGSLSATTSGASAK